MKKTTTPWDGFILSMEQHMKGKESISFDLVPMPLGLATIRRLVELEKKFNELSQKYDAQTEMLKKVLDKLEAMENTPTKKAAPLLKPQSLSK